MSITDKLQTLKNTKQAIKQALIDKGVEVSDTDNFASYADKITEMTTGSSNLNLYIDTPFVRPNLSSEGTLGGDTFAVSASHWDWAGNGGEVYKAMDGGSGTSWKCTIDDIWYKIYNPTPIKLTGVKFTWCWNNYSSHVELFASNDDNNYEKLNTISYQTDSLVGTLIVSNSNYYKYYKMVFVKTTNQVEIYEIDITATKKTLMTNGSTIGLQNKTITANGSYTADEGNIALGNVIVNVPGIVPSGSKTVTNNGIVDVTNYEKVNVNVSPGDNTVLNSLIDGTATSLYNDEVTSIGTYAFNNHKNLTSLSFPNVTTINSYAFQNCTNITSFELPEITTIQDHAFTGCSKMTSFDLSNVTNALYNCTFSNCTGLKKVWIPSTLTTIKASSSLTSSSYNYIYSPFYSCSSSLIIYTDANDRLPNWSNYCFNISSNTEATIVYNATYENYLLGTRPTANLTLSINVPDGCTITGKYSGEDVTDNIIRVFPNTSITLRFTLDSYLPLVKTYTIYEDNIVDNITISDFVTIPNSYDLHYDYINQEKLLTTLVDGTYYRIDSSKQGICCPASQQQLGNILGYYGYLQITPTEDVTLSITSKYAQYSSSYVYGCYSIYVGTQIYNPTNNQIYNNTKDAYGNYLERGYGGNYYKNGGTTALSNSSTFHTTSTTLSANTTYYICFAVTRYNDSYNCGTFTISDIVTTPIGE